MQMEEERIEGKLEIQRNERNGMPITYFHSGKCRDFVGTLFPTIQSPYNFLTATRRYKITSFDRGCRSLRSQIGRIGSPPQNVLTHLRPMGLSQNVGFSHAAAVAHSALEAVVLSNSSVRPPARRTSSTERTQTTCAVIAKLASNSNSDRDGSQSTTECSSHISVGMSRARR